MNTHPAQLLPRGLTAALLASITLITAAPAAHAETHQVKMLNRGAGGAMIYEPDFLKIKPGDTVKFRATSSGHDAASIPEMTPAGASTFKGKINEEVEVTFTEKGFYGIKCLPHYAMGMVMLIQVGDEADPKTVQIPDSVPARARKRFEQMIERAGKP
ncbi:MAG: pseudoazurin [Lautropia sp.]|nr:pseudoazurin [Lautropia sp.]